MTTRARLLLMSSALALVVAGASTAQDGFAISLNGQTLSGDPAVAEAVRRTDAALRDADVRVVFDGLGATPRLDLQLIGDGGRAGDQVTLKSSLNYPAFVDRGELRIIDRSLAGGARVVATAPIAPNGEVTIDLPEGEDLVAVHRVYDVQGRYDETAPLPLDQTGRALGASGLEEGTDTTRRRGIPISGGAVTVSGGNVTPGAQIATLGEIVTAGSGGRFVLQRILPPGDYGVDVDIRGGGRSLSVVRDITIPAADTFYVATADLTFVLREADGVDGRTTETEGRLAGFVDAKLASGTRITGSVDTGNGDLRSAFRRLNERDPRQLLLRVDPLDLYPTYGDDSTLEDATPTSGRLFLRVEQDSNFLQWGDFDADLGDNAFVRNDRSLYGLSAAWSSAGTTSAGEPVAQLLAYAAQPDMLPQRDVFRGTGGTVFFLEKQDIAQASETVSLQLRDPNTGRIIETRQLIAGEDYSINAIQGIVTLTRPLETAQREGLFSVGSPRDAEVVLIAAYEYTPAAGDVDGFAYGGRAEAWVSDRLRLGVSGMLDETGLSDHQLTGADLLLALSDGTYLRVDYAASEGTGFDSTYSADGGLIVEDIVSTGSSGEAIKVEARADLADLGVAGSGSVGAYYEKRTEGFSSLDVSVGPETGDEVFYGLSADIALNDRTQLLLGWDRYEAEAGTTREDGTAQIEVAATDTITYALGVETQTNTGGEDAGHRTDLAARVTYAPTDEASVFLFGQTTVDRDGLPNNDRYGMGASYAFGNGWSIEGEVSDGDLGRGGRILAAYEDENGNSRYLGWELEAGRDLDGIALRGRDRGRLVFGGRQTAATNVELFGENTYDLFGRHRSLTSAYGLSVAQTDQLNWTVAYELGRVDDGGDYDFERQALTFGVVYESEAFAGAARLEARREEGVLNGIDATKDSVLLTANARYEIDPAQRLVFSADIAATEAIETLLTDGRYADIVLGYAYRPVDNDRLNVLARYRYLYDLFGLRDATDESGIQQRSHVISVDATYDLTPQWTVGGKLGYRASRTRTDGPDTEMDNNAWLAVASARYHMVHDWDALLEFRQLNLMDAGTTETSALGAVYKSLNSNLKLGVGYNFGRFSDDLTDMTLDDQGAFVNILAQF